MIFGCKGTNFLRHVQSLFIMISTHSPTIFHFSSLISHLSSLIFHLSLKPPCLFCLIDGAKLHKKPMPSGKSVNNPTFRQLSVFSILFSVKSPSNRLLLDDDFPCSVGFRNPTALNISICNAATILVHILRHLWLYISHGDR